MASLFEELVDAIHAEYAEPQLRYGALRLKQQELGGVRRVIWIPTHLLFNTIAKTNPAIDPSGGERDAMYLEKWTVECHITGDSLEDAEAIRAKMLFVVRDVLGKAAKPIDGFWPGQESNEASVMDAGAQKVVVRFEWQINALEPAPQQVLVTGVQVDAGEPGSITITQE